MSANGDQGRGQGRDEKRTDQSQDRELSARLQDLLRAASTGQLSDISAQPGPFEQGMHLTGHAQKGRGSADEAELNGSEFPAAERDTVAPMHAKDDGRRVGSRLPDGESGLRQAPERDVAARDVAARDSVVSDVAASDVAASDVAAHERTRVLRGVPVPG